MNVTLLLFVFSNHNNCNYSTLGSYGRHHQRHHTFSVLSIEKIYRFLLVYSPVLIGARI